MVNLKNIINPTTNEVAESFIGKSGKRYYITKKLNVVRYVEFQTLSLSLAYGVNFQQFYNNLNDLKKILDDIPKNKKTFTDAVMYLHGLQTSILDSSQTKFDVSLYLCTLFIVSEDEDITSWSMEEADNKIKDWVQYDSQDFFFLCHHFVSGLVDEIKKLESSINRLNNQIISPH